MSIILRFIPGSVIRAAGRLQFRFPVLQRPINAVARRLTGAGVISRGAGRGLQFDAQGCNPGFLTGTSEPLEQELVLRFSRPGGVVYDLGANAGFYAVIAARAVGPSGHVYAFEPAPALAERVRANAASNRQANVTVVEAAVCDHDGTVVFAIDGDLSVTNSIRGSAADTSAKTVRAVTIDSLCPPQRPPTLMLFDIEGAEVEALAGSLRTIAAHRPVLMVEVHWVGETFAAFVRERLTPLGYAATTYDGRPLPTQHTRYHALLVPDRQISAVG